MNQISFNILQGDGLARVQPLLGRFRVTAASSVAGAPEYVAGAPPHARTAICPCFAKRNMPNFLAWTTTRD